LLRANRRHDRTDTGNGHEAEARKEPSTTSNNCTNASTCFGAFDAVVDAVRVAIDLALCAFRGG
jgi:hypothetical protein